MLRSTRTTRGPAPPAQRGPVGARLDLAWTGRLERRTEPVWKGERPSHGRLGDADDRAVPGRWGGSLLIGKDRKPALGTWSSRPPATACRCTCPWVRRLPGRARDKAGDHHRARRPGPHHHLGPGQTKWPTTRASPSPPASRLLMPAAQALAARLGRKNQGAAASEGSGGCSPPDLPGREHSRRPGWWCYALYRTHIWSSSGPV